MVAAALVYGPQALLLAERRRASPCSGHPCCRFSVRSRSIPPRIGLWGVRSLPQPGCASSTVAMDARGFQAATERTWAGPAPWRWSDSLVLGIGAALAALPWFLSRS